MILICKWGIFQLLACMNKRNVIKVMMCLGVDGFIVFGIRIPNARLAGRCFHGFRSVVNSGVLMICTVLVQLGGDLKHGHDATDELIEVLLQRWTQEYFGRKSHALQDCVKVKVS